MQKSYLTISVIVIIIGVAFIFLPATYEINAAPELVTLWEETKTAQQTVEGTIFSFMTGEVSIDDGISPYVRVWSDEEVSLNTTFYLTGSEEYDPLDMLDNPIEVLLPGLGTWSVQMDGTVVEGTEVEINAGFYYLRPLAPELITYYPYRFFGYGMAAIGVIATLVIYLRSKLLS